MAARPLVTIAVLMGALALAVAGVWTMRDRAPSSAGASEGMPVGSTATGSASSAPGAATTTPEATGGASEAAASPEQQAIAALTRYLALSDEVLQRGDGDASEARAVATGFVLGEIEAAAQERHDLQLRQVGTVAIADVDVVDRDLTGSPPMVTLSACLDVSGLDYIDPSGRSQKDRLYSPDRPVEHVFGVSFMDSGWLVSTHSIPSKSRCE